MHKQTILDRIEITRDGTIQLRFIKEAVDDEGTVLGNEFHRTACPPSRNVDTHMAAVNYHLVGLKWMPIEAAEIARIKALASVVWAIESRESSEPASEGTGAILPPLTPSVSAP